MPLPSFSQPWGSRCACFFHPSHPHLEHHHEPFTAVGTALPLSPVQSLATPLQSTPSQTWYR